MGHFLERTGNEKCFGAYFTRKLYLTTKYCMHMYVRYGSQKSSLFLIFIKTVFIRATETERLGHGTVRSMVN